ncbi:hypothetical protein CBS101457_005374 [Exobasidium rhododendri]|nr:hypothetical protein CBS101457_005374 [Exobasidium rhododendri]
MAPKAASSKPKSPKKKKNGAANVDVIRSTSTTTPSASTVVVDEVVVESVIVPPPSVAGASWSWSHLLLLLGFNLALMAMTLWSHYHLPTPRSIEVESLTSPAHFSEQAALEHISVLSDTIGYRIVGTKQHVEAEQWLESVVKQYEGWHRTVEGSDAGNFTGSALGDTQVEVWTQIGDGSHRFDFMSSVVWKKYYSMSNVIVRISDGTEAGKEHAVLLNSHLDSTLPSPGAADDGAGVAIQLEMLRILTTAPRPRLRHAVILLFNNGEESLQDASHLYTTQHTDTMPSVRGVVNLEACGTSGPELLFQATSVPFVEAYSKVPYPYGTVLANDIFSTGLILSDTDFRQFVQYGNLSGLDIAVVGNSYLYHTRSDVTSALQPGMLQHFGENILAIVNHLATSPASNLARNEPFPKRTPPIYFSIAGRYFFLISAAGFRPLVMAICALTNFLLTTTGKSDKHFGALRHIILSLLFTIGSLLGALVSTNVVALIMTQLIGKPLSWFTHENLPVALYGPPSVTAIFAVQYLFSKLTKPEHRAYLERASLDGLLLFFVIGLIGLSMVGIGSAYLCMLGGGALLFTIATNDIFLVGMGELDEKRVAAQHRVHPLTYFTLSLMPAIVGTEGVFSFLDLFVPLTGRTGEISPADHIVGTIVAALSFLSIPFLLPLSHRMGNARLSKAILAGLAISAISIAIFASPSLPAFDAAHPKRIFVHQVQNLTSDSYWMNIGGADPDVKGLEGVVNDMYKEMGIPGQGPTLMEMDSYNPDFDILYPVSNFITPFKFLLPNPSTTSPWSLPPSSLSPSSIFKAHSAEESFFPHATQDHIDWEARTRQVTITIERKNIIWSVIAFDAEILEWDLGMPPPVGFQRHHLKEVSRYGQDSWSVSMLLKLPVDATKSTYSPTSKKDSLIRESQGVPVRDPAKLWIDYSGLIADGMWPQAERLSVQEQSKYPSLSILSRMDNILKRTHPECDSMLLSVLAAVAQV